LGISEDFTEFIEHVKTRIDITGYENFALVKKPDNEKLGAQNDEQFPIKSDKKTMDEKNIEVIQSKSEEPEKNLASSTNSKERKICITADDSKILPEKISKLYFNLSLKKTFYCSD